MSRAFALARRGRLRAHPNPKVGCVIIQRGRVVGEGWHERFGGPHAEALALARAGTRAKGGTLYVTLEPCPHWGKTPPCAQAVARAGLRRLVVGEEDPAPSRRGRGLALLRRAGVAVDRVPRRHGAEGSDRGFFSRHRRGRPYVIFKAAQTLDGKIASTTGASRWITGPVARRLGHRLRAESDAVLVGGATVRLDDPALTAHGAGPDPLRIVLSGRLDFPPKARVVRGGGPTWVITSALASRARGRRLEAAGAQVIRLPGANGRVEPKALLTALARRGVGQLLIEGGGEVAALFLAAGLVDEIYAFIAPRLLGGREAPTSVEGAGWRHPSAGPVLRNPSVRRVGSDWLFHGFLSGKG